MRTLAALGLALILCGCAKDNEDRAFFNEGWVKPQEGADRRMYQDYATPKPAPKPADERTLDAR